MLPWAEKKRAAEGAMMSQGSKRELLATIRPRYRKASKKEKQKFLDEFVAVTGYHRKYAIRVMNSSEEAGATENLSRRGGNSVRIHLGDLWADLFETFAAFLARDCKSART